MRPPRRPAPAPDAWMVPGAPALHKPRGHRYGMPCTVVRRGGGQLVTVQFAVGGPQIVAADELYDNALQLAPREPAA